ncbi:MAG: hypothetical protein OXH09_18390 [Gammaproteobacteria bacterium]|nr:hypothetical protein [Gammaproteobacteria bacterium]
MHRLPNIELLDILEPAYAPCEAFHGACAGTATWLPQRGHAPRGFLGATGRVDDIELVLLVAEPGNPHAHSRFAPDLLPQSMIAQAVDDTYRCFRDGADLFHRNMRHILDLAFPGLALDDQLRRAWITNTYLCSAPEEAGSVPAAASIACASTYLQAQLELLARRPVIALGRKASARVKRLRSAIPDLADRLFFAYAASPPGCNHRGAYPSWSAATKGAQQYVQSSPRSASRLAMPHRRPPRHICYREVTASGTFGRTIPRS